MTKPQQTFYQIRVKGHLDPGWSGWFAGLTIHHEQDGETLLRGWLADQAALYGVLFHLGELALPLLEVRPVPEGEADTS